MWEPGVEKDAKRRAVKLVADGYDETSAHAIAKCEANDAARARRERRETNQR